MGRKIAGTRRWWTGAVVVVVVVVRRSKPPLKTRARFGDRRHNNYFQATTVLSCPNTT